MIFSLLDRTKYLFSTLATFESQLWLPTDLKPSLYGIQYTYYLFRHLSSPSISSFRIMFTGTHKTTGMLDALTAPRQSVTDSGFLSITQ